MAKKVVSEEHIIDSDDYLSADEAEEIQKEAAAAALEKALAVPKGYHNHKIHKSSKKLLKGNKKYVLIRVPKGFDIESVKDLKDEVKVDGEKYSVEKSESNKSSTLNVISGHIKGQVVKRITVTKKIEIPSIQYDKVVVPRKDVEVVKF